MREILRRHWGGSGSCTGSCTCSHMQNHKHTASRRLARNVTRIWLEFGCRRRRQPPGSWEEREYWEGAGRHRADRANTVNDTWWWDAVQRWSVIRNLSGPHVISQFSTGRRLPWAGEHLLIGWCAAAAPPTGLWCWHRASTESKINHILVRASKCSTLWKLFKNNSLLWCHKGPWCTGTNNTKWEAETWFIFKTIFKYNH